MHASEDTIAAAATPFAESALAVVRVSGPACMAVLEAVSTHKCAEARKALYGAYKALDGTLLDSCVFVPYPDGKSYTGEPMLEISTHGNPAIVQSILRDLFARGCRPAQPGEFTRRAFLNGKMDLTQAEAVQQIISARSQRAIEAAQRQLGGSVGRAVGDMLDRLMNLIAHTEAYIDFPEEDLPPESEEGPISQLIELTAIAKRYMATAPYSALLHEGARTVIAGLPNAGKSSLLNALLCEERAIVSPEPGTTRDYIEERLVVGPHLLRIVDTAGLREGAGRVEEMGVERSRMQIAQADLVLLVVDASAPSPTLPFDAATMRHGAAQIVVENKCDLPRAFDAATLFPDVPHVRISACNGDGIEALKERISTLLDATYAPPGQDDILVSARHAEALRCMNENLAQAMDKLRKKGPAELVASDLRAALSELDSIVGRIDNERILDLVFSKFCIGK
jgi:tRNA modification GTPase